MGEACLSACELSGEACPGEIVWERPFPVNPSGEISISDDGQIYVTAAVPVENSQAVQPTIYALNADGEIQWEEQLGMPSIIGFPSRAVIAEDGTIYVTTSLRLFSFAPNGRLRFAMEITDDIEESINYLIPAPPPTIGKDGTVYWQYLAASRDDGSLVFRTYLNPETPCENIVPARPDRVLFRELNAITALNQQGQVVWRVERPMGMSSRDSCSIVPYDDSVIATMWCEQSASVFACGHVVYIDLETGEPRWMTRAPVPEPGVRTVVSTPDGSMVAFSSGPRGNPDYHAKMWTIGPNGQKTSDPIELPWHGIYGAALGDDGILYVSTSEGPAAITLDGEIAWAHPVEFGLGSYTGTPSIGENGCVYFELVQQFESRQFLRRVACFKSTATGLAMSKWPHANGGNHFGLRSP